MSNAQLNRARGRNTRNREMVSHPEHYNHGIEVIDFIESWNLDFNEGSIVKYVTRHEYKHEDPKLQLEDLRKAEFYLQRLIEAKEKEISSRR